MPASPVVSNSTCLISLSATGELALLEKLFGSLTIPPAVARELVSVPIPSWVRIVPAQNRLFVKALQTQLGAGESEAIALSLSLSS